MFKKILILAFAAAAGLALSRRMSAKRAEQQLWTEATDPVTS